MTFQPKGPLSDGGLLPPSDFEHDVLALQPALCAFARCLARQACDAEDLVQDTILKALGAQARFEPGTNLKAWLFTILRNSFNSRWRRSRREVATASEVMELEAVASDTQETSLWARQVAERLLQDLSSAHREILLLVAVQGVSYEEAARVLGCSEGTVKSRMSRARAALAALVEGTAP